MLKVFVSSTMTDLRVHRDEVRKLIEAHGLEDIAMERWPASADRPTAQIEQAIAESDVFVAIVAWKYGERIQPENISYTEFEYRLAQRRHQMDGMPMLMFLADPNVASIPMAFVDRGEDSSAVERFREQIKSDQALTWRLFCSPADLVRKLSAALYPILLQNSRAMGRLSAEDRLVIEMRQAAYDDLLARGAEIKASRLGGTVWPTEGQNPDASVPEPGTFLKVSEWFIPGLARCNVGDRYIQRPEVRRSVADWLVRGEPSFLFLVGPSGIGKTNFLVEFIHIALARRSPLRSDAILMLSLGAYDPRKGFIANVADFLLRSGRFPDLRGEDTVRRLFQQQRVLLILDGLDEFARMHEEGDACQKLFQAIHADVPPAAVRAIVSCRDHIYNRLSLQTWFTEVAQREPVLVAQLSKEEVKRESARRNGPDSLQSYVLNTNPRLLNFACNPLLFEMMCQFSRNSWQRLVQAPSLGRLYDLWFEEMAGVGAPAELLLAAEPTDDTRAALESVAKLMLERRSDLISVSDLRSEGLPLDRLQTLIRQPFGILIRQTPDEWGFVHDSFREFALARIVASELASRDYRLLSRTSSFDYVGAETYQFLRELQPSTENLLQQFEGALASDADDMTAWNHRARNCFEAVGMVGDDENAERFIDHALAILDPLADVNSNWRHLFGRAEARTMYWIVRSIERLHPSAQRPYCTYMLSQNWPKESSWGAFDAGVVVGFRLSVPRADYYRNFVYGWQRNTSDARRQREVSDFLLRLLELRAQTQDTNDQFVALNCTFALIRWLHSDHVDRTLQLMGRVPLSPMMKGNLFLALTRFRQRDIFRGYTDVFAGMELCAVFLSPEMLPPVHEFQFKDVLFLGYERCRLEGFRQEAFVNCGRERRRSSQPTHAALLP